MTPPETSGASPFSPTLPAPLDFLDSEQAAHEELMQTFEAFRNASDLRFAALERHLGDDVVQRDKIDRLNAQLSKQQERLDCLAAAAQRPPLEAAASADVDMPHSTGMTSKKALTPQYHAWESVMRKGYGNGFLEAERKALTTSTDAEGGFIAPPEIEHNISRMLAEASPFRGIASVRVISAGIYKKPVSLGSAGSGWVGETTARTQTTTPRLAELEFPAMELYAMPAASSVLLDDAVVAIDQWLGEEIRGVFAEQETAAFVSGDGRRCPRGFLDYPNVADSSWEHGKLGFIKSGANGNFASSNPTDILIDLIYSLKPIYRHNARWMMNRSTLAAIRKFRDADGTSLWYPGQGSGQASTLLGYPVVELEDMPDMAANVTALAFGDFRSGYLIVDRAGLHVLRDPYTAKPYTLFYTTKRVGGGIQDFAAIKLMKFSA